MKEKLIGIVLLFISAISYSQQEVKLNLANAIVFKAIDVSYEYYINKNSSVGVSGFYNFEKKTANFRYNEEKMLTPYFRNYFTTEKSWNIFGEAFVAINSGFKEIEEIGGETSYNKYSDAALGIAIGAKFIATSGLVIDVFGGLGRNLFTSESPILLPRLGLNIGWRF